MFMFAVRLAFASLLVATCVGPTTAHAQTAPVQYWIPGWPVGFSNGSNDAASLESYENFPGFIGNGDSGFFSRRYSYTNNWSAIGGLGLQGISPYASFGPLTTEGSQFGYRFKSGVALYGGFDTLRADRGSNAFAAFDSNSSTLPVYSAHGGVEFQPAPNVSLSLGFSYTGQGSDRLDSDIRSPALPGETPSAFTSGRR
jgi:opacity protein-like surface antigen